VDGAGAPAFEEANKVLGNLDIHREMDDFGADCPSLRCLNRFSMGILKIEKLFINGLDQDPDSAALATAAIPLARPQAVEGTAEGLQAHGQMVHLHHLNYDQGQGYPIFRALPAEVAGILLAQNPVGGGGSFL